MNDDQRAGELLIVGVTIAAAVMMFVAVTIKAAVSL